MPTARASIPTRRTLAWLLGLAVAFVLLGLLYSAYLLSWDAEWTYMTMGRLALTGRIGLFQDEMMGERLPLPYYVIGLSQLITGPSLLSGRVISLAFGLLALGFTFLAARSIAGNGAGLLAAAFLATHAMVVGYYAAASYFGFCAALMAAGIAALTGLRRPAGSLVCMACFTAVAFSRANLAVMAPLVLIYMLVTADTLRERVGLLVVCGLPALAFFLWSTDHLKILAYVPGLGGLVAPLGYRSAFALGTQALWIDREGGENLVWFIKRHAAFIAPTVVLAAALLVARARGHRITLPRPVWLVAVLVLYTFGWQMIILRFYLKSIAAWAATFAPLWAIVLGCVAAAVLDAREARIGPVRIATAIACGVSLLLSPAFSRHAAMPRPLPDVTTVRAYDVAATTFRASISPDQRVFVLGNPLLAYLAGGRLYPQQTFHFTTLVPSTDHYAVSRSGFWGERELEQWLGRDAAFAVVEPAVLEVLRAVPAYTPLVARLETLLGQHFRRVVEVGSVVGAPRQVLYRRVGS